MVSIMRPEQTLRLIQLYHANYPEIARNNQDADGRNLKLQMWAQITEELNSAYETQFTVEQFKKKVQNVQCTSRQKMYSGKRNLGEAEVEYLRLFETDKISEEVLVQRAKNRSSSCKSFSSSPHPMDFLAFDNGSREAVDHNSGHKKEEEEGEREGSSTGTETEESLLNGTGNGANGIGIGLLPSMAMANAVLPIGQQGEAINSPADCPQLESSAQQFLLAMLNVTLNGIGVAVDGQTGIEGAKKRKENEQELQKAQNEQIPMKRSRKPDRPTRASPLELAVGDGQGEEKPIEEKPRKEKPREEKLREEKPAEADEGKKQATKQQKPEASRQNELTAETRKNSSSSTSSSQTNLPIETKKPISGADSAAHLILPVKSPLPANVPVPSSTASCCQCQGTQGEGGKADDDPISQLNARLDTTNAILARIADLIADRWPPTNGNGPK